MLFPDQVELIEPVIWQLAERPARFDGLIEEALTREHEVTVDSLLHHIGVVFQLHHLLAGF